MSFTVPPASPLMSGFGPAIQARQPLQILPVLQDTFTRQATMANMMAASFMSHAFSNAAKHPPSGAPGGAYLPPLPPASKLPGYHSLRIVFNNDPHEKFKALPHLVSAFRLLSAQGDMAGRDVLRLNSGDNNVGREPEEWALNVRMLNLVGYHAVTMGNHELDAGSDGYAKGLEHAAFPTVLSNLKIPPDTMLAQRVREGKIRTMPQIIKDKHGAYGLIGVTTPELKTVVSSSAKLNGVDVQDKEETFANVKAQVDYLQSQGINKVIVLSHMGYDLDQKLAQQVAGIDIIVGGHSHDVVRGINPGANYLKTPTGEPVLIVQGGKNAEWMGVADVLFDPQGRVIPQQNVLFNPYTQPADPQALAIRNSVLGTPKKMAEISTAYDANGNEAHSDSVAQFTADAIRAVSGADIAFVRSSEIRSNIDRGAFTDHDLKALMPFMDPVVRLKVSGEEILEALERSAEAMVKKERHPGMLHPSGMAVSMNKQTGKVEQAFVLNQGTKKWEHLNPKKQYSMALGEFSVQNKEFPEFAHPDRVDWNSKQPLQAFFAWGLQQAGAPNRSIGFRDDGRLNII